MVAVVILSMSMSGFVIRWLAVRDRAMTRVVVMLGVGHRLPARRDWCASTVLTSADASECGRARLPVVLTRLAQAGWMEVKLMNKAILNSLSEPDQVLVMQTERGRLIELDEDELVDLHTRVRRARNKYVKLYRRQASNRVAEQGGRGKARPKNRRNADRAEVFEFALARVSRRLGAEARRSAAALRAERLAAARRGPSKKPPKGGANAGTTKPGGQKNDDRRLTTPAAKKRVSTSAAAGNRRQAKKDRR